MSIFRNYILTLVVLKAVQFCEVQISTCELGLLDTFHRNFVDLSLTTRKATTKKGSLKFVYWLGGGGLGFSNSV